MTVDKSEYTRAISTVVFNGSIILANVLIAKLTWIELPGLGDVAVPTGFIRSASRIVLDPLVEYHGKEYAVTIVTETIVSLVITCAFIPIATRFC